MPPKNSTSGHGLPMLVNAYTNKDGSYTQKFFAVKIRKFAKNLVYWLTSLGSVGGIMLNFSG